MSEAFRHVDSARTIVFGPAALAGSAELIGEGYTLLSTPRAAASAPEVLERAATMIEVPGGQVDVVAAQLRGTVTGSRLVALGGGRAIGGMPACRRARGLTGAGRAALFRLS